jgi:Flp pilus assembly protein TadD
VLNYLGYSWVDQGQNMKQAMDYIRKAVKLKPDDGYYVDSLGWAYYRLGNLPAAVENLERAVELKPDDPIINDHLGDAYWKVGRTLEAKYQWQQALTLKPEDEQVVTLKQKIEAGLPDDAATKSAQDRTTQTGQKTPQ